MNALVADSFFNASENARKGNALNRFALSLAGCVFRSLLLRNQQVAGPNPATSSKLLKLTKASQSGAFCLLFAICRFSPFALCALKTSDMQLMMSFRAPCDGDAPVLMHTDTFRPRVPADYFFGVPAKRHSFVG